MIYILLVAIIVELGAIIYLSFRRLPEEIKKELVRSVVKVEGKVLEYIPPEEEQDKTARELTETITKR